MRSFGGTVPQFAPNAKTLQIGRRELTVYYDMQCPYVSGRIKAIRQYCAENNSFVSLIDVNSPEMAKSLPCVFDNWAVFCNGNFETVNLPDAAAVKRLTERENAGHAVLHSSRSDPAFLPALASGLQL